MLRGIGHVTRGRAQPPTPSDHEGRSVFFRRLCAALASCMAAGLLLLAVDACTTETGATPGCDQELVGDGGRDKNVKNPCSPFAVCVDQNQNAQHPKICCKGLDGGDYQL